MTETAPLTRVYVGIGSNVNRQANIRAGLDALYQAFGPLVVSPVYACAAVGFCGDDFFNLAASFSTQKDLPAVIRLLKQLELAQGRDFTAPRFSAKTLDIDVLLWGDFCGEQAGLQLPRPDITEHAYVLAPLADLAGDRRLPGTQRRLAELWLAMSAGASLRPVDFNWDCGGG